MISIDLAWALIFLGAFALAINLRLKNDRVFNKFVDPILFFQAVFVVARFVPDLSPVWLTSYLISLVLAIILSLLNSKKSWRNKLLITGLLLPVFITLFAKVEHYSWATLVSFFEIVSAMGLVWLVLFRSKLIKEEFPFLVLFLLNALIAVGYLVWRFL